MFVKSAAETSLVAGIGAAGMRMSSDLSQFKSKPFTLEEAVAGTKMSPNLKAKILIVFNNWVQPAVNQGWFVRRINFGVKHEVLLCAFSPFLGGFFWGCVI